MNEEMLAQFVELARRRLFVRFAHHQYGARGYWVTHYQCELMTLEPGKNIHYPDVVLATYNHFNCTSPENERGGFHYEVIDTGDWPEIIGSILNRWESEGYNEWLVLDETVALYQPERDAVRSPVPLCNPNIIRVLSRIEGHIESVVSKHTHQSPCDTCELCALRRLNDRLGGLITSQIGNLTKTKVSLEAAYRAMTEMPLFTRIG